MLHLSPRSPSVRVRKLFERTAPVFLAAAALIFLVLPGTASADSSLRQWQWPVSPEPEVLRHFEPPPQRWMPGHRGVDLASVEAGGILSPAGGVVAFVGTVVNRPVITLDHGNGLLSSFEPVSSSLVKGEEITEGQVIGQLSAEAHCPVACVHWGVRLQGEYVNPLNFVSDRRPSILLPLDGWERPGGLR